MAATPDPFRVGLLGHGTVGSAFEELLDERADAVAATTGLRPSSPACSPARAATSRRSSTTRT